MSNDVFDTLRNLVGLASEGDFDDSTPLLDQLNTELNGRTFDVKRGAVYQVRGVGSDVQILKHPDGTTFLQEPNLHVYGEMTVGDRVDNSAAVVVRKHHAWCKGNAWNGTKWADMPEGARRRVAEAVEAEVLRIVPNESYWQMVAYEAWALKQGVAIRSHLQYATRELELAIERLNVRRPTASGV